MLVFIFIFEGSCVGFSCMFVEVKAIMEKKHFEGIKMIKTFHHLFFYFSSMNIVDGK